MKELTYWQLCQERAEVVAASVREKMGDPTVSRLLLARMYYERDSYRCHRCGMHWQGKGTLFPCAHPRKSVCRACRGKCSIDCLADAPRSWTTLEVAAAAAGYTVEYSGQIVQIGTLQSGDEHSYAVAVFPKATGYDDAVRWLRCREERGRRASPVALLSNRGGVPASESPHTSGKEMAMHHGLQVGTAVKVLWRTGHRYRVGQDIGEVIKVSQTGSVDVLYRKYYRWSGIAPTWVRRRVPLNEVNLLHPAEAIEWEAYTPEALLRLSITKENNGYTLCVEGYSAEGRLGGIVSWELAAKLAVDIARQTVHSYLDDLDVKEWTHTAFGSFTRAAGAHLYLELARPLASGSDDLFYPNVQGYNAIPLRGDEPVPPIHRLSLDEGREFVCTVAREGWGRQARALETFQPEWHACRVRAARSGAVEEIEAGEERRHVTEEWTPEAIAAFAEEQSRKRLLQLRERLAALKQRSASLGLEWDRTIYYAIPYTLRVRDDELMQNYHLDCVEKYLDLPCCTGEATCVLRTDLSCSLCSRPCCIYHLVYREGGDMRLRSMICPQCRAERKHNANEPAL